MLDNSIIIQEFRRRVFEESFVRIRKCLDELTVDEIWTRPNSNLSSIGNLILHLNGNARQWILSGLIGKEDIRERSKEFLSAEKLKHDELHKMLDVLKSDLDLSLNEILSLDLTEKRNVQGFSESGVSILIHVVEHFSYHTGQITWYTKFLKQKDMNYYSGINLEAK